MDKKFEIPKPVSTGDIIDVEIESQGGQGDGIAKVEDFVIFVKGGRKGEKCKVRIVDVKRTYAIGEKTESKNNETVQEMDDETEGRISS